VANEITRLDVNSERKECLKWYSAITDIVKSHNTTNSKKLERIAESFRDWGRDCYCQPGKDNTCGKRFCQQLGDLPFGYDHKYTYSHLGYNLKITDMQAACGLAQLERAPEFIQTRKDNFIFF
jgi:CDP-6-deoxy-D-xylo-4-hexulose-3-dehydrase